MADVNKFYDGVIEYFDPHGDSGLVNLSTCNIFGFDCSNFWLNEMPFWPELQKVNDQSGPTVAAVKIEFSGTTLSERKGWLEQRIAACDNRATFIRTRTANLLKALQESGSDSYIQIEKLVTTALSVLPVVGSVVSGIESNAQASRNLDAHKLQVLLQDYVKDLNSLAQIRQALVDEYAAIPTTVKTTATKDPTSNAPTVSTWYYYAGAGLLLFLFVWYRRRKLKRSKR